MTTVAWPPRKSPAQELGYAVLMLLGFVFLVCAISGQIKDLVAAWPNSPSDREIAAMKQAGEQINAIHNEMQKKQAEAQHLGSSQKTLREMATVSRDYWLKMLTVQHIYDCPGDVRQQHYKLCEAIGEFSNVLEDAAAADDPQTRKELVRVMFKEMEEFMREVMEMCALIKRYTD